MKHLAQLQAQLSTNDELGTRNFGSDQIQSHVSSISTMCFFLLLTIAFGKSIASIVTIINYSRLFFT